MGPLYIRLEHLERDEGVAKLRFTAQGPGIGMDFTILLDANHIDAADWVGVARRKLHEQLAGMAEQTRVWAEARPETDRIIKADPSEFHMLTRESSPPAFPDDIMVRSLDRLRG